MNSASAANGRSGLRVCQVIDCVNRNTGGPAISVTRLAAALGASGVDSHVFAFDYPNLGPCEETGRAILHTVPSTSLSRRLGGFRPEGRRALSQLAGQGFHVVHNHGLWMFPNLYAREAALRNRLPLVISPRGMLEDWSLRRSRVKKFVAWHCFEKRNLAAASLFHATSTEEADSIRRVGLPNPIAVIPNGIDLPAETNRPPRVLLEELFPELCGRRWLLFLSRLHPKKGVADLLGVWRELEQAFPDWQLILAGPDADGYGTNLLEAVENKRVAGRISMTGMLSGDLKACALSNADLFVLPSHSENFGIAIAEAMAHGVPVVTTKATPWEDVQTYRCGWWIDLNRTTLGATLREAMALPEEARKEMGSNGRSLVKGRYHWDQAASQMRLAYLWCCGRGVMPDWIWTQ